MTPTSTSTTRPVRADVRTAILDAAAEEFLERGYLDATMSGIAARAGFTKGAAYSNFEGKPELFAAACTRRFASVTALVGPQALRSLQRADAGASTTIAEQLADETISWSDWHVTLNEFRALARRDPQVAARYAEVRDTQRRAVADLLRDAGIAVRSSSASGVGSPVDEPDPYDVAATLVVGLVSQLAMEHAIAPDHTPRALMVSCLARLIDGLLA